ncbi:MAG: hypothetical protein PF480_11780 [Roseovarius sp.]|nr:hypothetical protein [Roseovarius sp.]
MGKDIDFTRPFKRQSRAHRYDVSQAKQAWAGHTLETGVGMPPGGREKLWQAIMFRKFRSPVIGLFPKRRIAWQGVFAIDDPDKMPGADVLGDAA